jgi:hypothetical protein
VLTLPGPTIIIAVGEEEDVFACRFPVVLRHLRGWVGLGVYLPKFCANYWHCPPRRHVCLPDWNAVASCADDPSILSKDVWSGLWLIALSRGVLIFRIRKSSWQQFAQNLGIYDR